MAVLCAGCAEGEKAEPGLAAPPPSGETAVVPKTVPMAVSWPEEAAIDRTALAALSEKNRRAVALSQVPVLVASDPGLLAQAVVMARPNFTAISSRHEGVTVSLHAHRLAHRHPEIPPAEGNRLVRGHKGFVTQNEAIWSATWIENGISYDLDVECGSLPDPRCDDERYLLELASSLRYVGGKPHAGEVLP